MSHRILRTILLASVLLASNAPRGTAAETGTSVVVIYNPKMEGSKSVADHYAERRGVPVSQVFGYELPTTEEMTRQEYLSGLQEPLLRDLQKNGLIKIETQEGDSGQETRRLVDASIRYVALCYGVPTKVSEDESLVEKKAASLKPELQVTQCSVDSQLACLPLSLNPNFVWTGPADNPHYRATNSTYMHPTNGLLMVSRLDGPTANVARGLVDLAMSAETNGLWGRAYIDSRGLTNGPALLGDEWMRAAFQICRIDFPTEFDNQEATFGAGYPMSQIAIYAGWYDQGVSGPFALPQVDFMPGAFAYHLHSFSARSIRLTNGWWVGPLLAKGAGATIGNVYEPYLALTEDVPQFLSAWLGRGFTFAEAAWSGIRVLSWQTIMIGDPLYAPARRSPQELHLDLEKRRPDLLPWSHLRVVTRNLAQGTKPTELIGYIQSGTPFRQSSILLETLGDLNLISNSFADGLLYYEEALRREMTDPQRLRVLFKLANQRNFFGPNSTAIELFQRILKEFPSYPDRLGIYEKILPMARDEGMEDLVKECEESIRKLKNP